MWEWTADQRLQPGTATFKDYNFTTPAADLTAKTSQKASYADYSTFEVYEYPGPYAVVADGTTISNVRMQRFTRQSQTLQGESNSRLIYTGCKMTLSGFADDSQNIEYLVVGATYTIGEAAGVPSTDGAVADAFVCKMRAIPGSMPFQLDEITHWPRMYGPQTAKVVVASGDEITTDTYGRIKVKFPWDRSSAQDDSASCWIRVAQIWAGAQWGSMYIPRVGQEVVVDFLNGNPDRPIIVGCVYNANNKPPDTLPDNKTMSDIMTNSSPGGGGFNQLRFEDKKGSEVVNFQAQKDYTKLVKNNETVTIDQGNRSITLNTGDNSLTVSKGNNSITVSEGNDSKTVSKGNHSITVSTGNDSLTVSQGNHSITVSAGSSTVNAGQSITLQVGSNSIVINTSGVTINGSMVSVQASGDMTLQGAMVSIN
jgi:type VI secretion system secreted protein VgrG